MKNTAGDFWRMVWEMKSMIIIMLTNTEENEEVSFKCLLLSFYYYFLLSLSLSLSSFSLLHLLLLLLLLLLLYYYLQEQSVQYWPSNPNEEEMYGSFNVIAVPQDRTLPDYIVRKFKVSHSSNVSVWVSLSLFCNGFY